MVAPAVYSNSKVVEAGSEVKGHKLHMSLTQHLHTHTTQSEVVYISSLRQEDSLLFEASLRYSVRACLKSGTCPEM